MSELGLADIVKSAVFAAMTIWAGAADGTAKIIPNKSRKRESPVAIILKNYHYVLVTLRKVLAGLSVSVIDHREKTSVEET